MAAQTPGSDHVKQGKALLSRVKQLRGHVGSDPSKAEALADALNDLTANRLVAHQFGEATGDAQEAVAAAAKLLTEAGPIGAYTPSPLAARYYTAVTHVAVAQVGLGMPDAAASTMASLDEFRAKLVHPLASALHPRTAVWALSAQARGCLAAGDVGAANAFADAALTRVERSGLRGSGDDRPVVIDTELLIADTRWAAGHADESLQHLRTASELHADWADELLAEAPRVSPALLKFHVDPLVAVQRSLAERLASAGDEDAADRVRVALVERLKPIAGRLGPDGKAMLADLEASAGTTAGPVPEHLAGWAPVLGQAALAPEVEAFLEPEEQPVPDLEALAAERAAARAEADRVQAEREAAARAEAERVAAERAERERAERDRLEQERLEQERLEREQLEREQLEQERMDAEEAERRRHEEERMERERMMSEEADRQRREAERFAAEETERQRLEGERFATAEAEQEHVDYDREESERLVAEQAEQERLGTESLVSAHEVAFSEEQLRRHEQAAPEIEEETESERVAAEQVRVEESVREPALTEVLAEEEQQREAASEEYAAGQEQQREAPHEEHTAGEDVRAVEADREARPTEEPDRAEARRAEHELTQPEPVATGAPDTPTADPVLDRYRAAQAAYAEVRSQGGRRAARDAATELVDSLRPLLDRDRDAWLQTMIASLTELASARRAVADLWGARAASKEARELEGR